MNKYKILFVCMGNICRSPAAEEVFRVKSAQAGLSRCLEIDSAGTHAYHEGEPPDLRMRKASAKRGYDLGRLRARRLNPRDYEYFDRILAMDRQNLAFLRTECPYELQGKLGLFMEYAADLGVDEVPDPYYGSADGFERVLDLCEAAAAGLVASVAPIVRPRDGD